MAITVSKKLLRVAGKTNAQFKLIGQGDKVLVGLSGGKDSLALVHVLRHMQRHAPFKFTFEAVTVNYGMPNEQYDALHEHCKENEIIHHVFETNIFDVSQDAIRPNSSFCSYFSRMRRGALYSYAELGVFNKVALGHHFDDMAESFFMNMLYNGTMRTLAPIYKADRGFHLIRPLIMVRESQTRGFVEDNALVAIGDEACPAMLKDVKAPYARAKTKEWLKGMEMENKNLFKMLQSSLSNIHDDTFLDSSRWRRDDLEQML